MASFKHSCVLFIDPLGEPMQFFMRPCSEFSDVKQMIEHGGGILCTKGGSGIMRLVPVGCKLLNVSEDEVLVSLQYIYDCVEKNIALDIDSYVMNVSSVDVSDISEDENYKCPSHTAVAIVQSKPWSQCEEKDVVDVILKNKSDFLKLTYPEFVNKHMKARVQRTLRAVMNRIKHLTNNVNHSHISPEKRKSFINLVKLKQEQKPKVYSIHDDWKMLNFIFDRSLCSELPKMSVFRTMAELKVTSYSARSMHKHFMHYILKHVHNYDLPKDKVKQLLRAVGDSENVSRKPNKSTRSSKALDEDTSDESDHKLSDCSFNETTPRKDTRGTLLRNSKEAKERVGAFSFMRKKAVTKQHYPYSNKNFQTSEKFDDVAVSNKFPCTIKEEILETESEPSELENVSQCNRFAISTDVTSVSEFNNEKLQVPDAISSSSKKASSCTSTVPTKRTYHLRSEQANQKGDFSLGSEMGCENSFASCSVKSNSNDKTVSRIQSSSNPPGIHATQKKLLEDNQQSEKLGNITSHLKSQQEATFKSVNRKRNGDSHKQIPGKHIHLRLYDPECCSLSFPEVFDNSIPSEKIGKHDFKGDEASSELFPACSNNELKINVDENAIVTSTPILSPPGKNSDSTPDGLDSYDRTLLKSLRNHLTAADKEKEEITVISEDDALSETIIASQKTAKFNNNTTIQHRLTDEVRNSGLVSEVGVVGDENSQLIVEESFGSKDVIGTYSDAVMDDQSCVPSTSTQSKYSTPSAVEEDFFSDATMIVYKLEKALHSLRGSRNKPMKAVLQQDLCELKSQLFKQLLTLQVEKVMKKARLSIGDKALLTKYLSHGMGIAPEEVLQKVLNSS